MARSLWVRICVSRKCRRKLSQSRVQLFWTRQGSRRRGCGGDAHLSDGGDSEILFRAHDGFVLVLFACDAVRSIEVWLRAGISWSMEDKSTSPGSGSDFGAGRGLVGSLSVLAAFCTCDMLIVGLLPFFLTSSSVVVSPSHTDYDFNACFFWRTLWLLHRDRGHMPVCLSRKQGV